jgi:hypothetical protein
MVWTGHEERTDAVVGDLEIDDRKGGQWTMYVDEYLFDLLLHMISNDDN